MTLGLPQGGAKRRTTRIALTILRVLLGVLPLVWILRHVNLHELGRTILSVPTHPLLPSFLLSLAALFAGSVRWRVLLHQGGGENVPSALGLIFRNLVGIYYNALPSGLLGEGYRAHQVRACLPNQEISYFIVAFERLLGLMALLALAGLAHGLAPMPWHPLFTWVYSILGGAGLMALAAAFGLAPLMKKNLGQIVRVKFPWLGLLAGGVCTPRKMGIPFLLSCVSQTCFVSSIYCLLAPRLGAGMALNAFSVIPFIVLFNFVQVTPGGFGQREAVFVFCLGRIGFPSNVALSVSIMFYLVQTSIALLGGLCHFLERRRV